MHNACFQRLDTKKNRHQEAKSETVAVRENTMAGEIAKKAATPVITQRGELAARVTPKARSPAKYDRTVAICPKVFGFQVLNEAACLYS
jgi:hypothetical protein